MPTHLALEEHWVPQSANLGPCSLYNQIAPPGVSSEPEGFFFGGGDVVLAVPATGVDGSGRTWPKTPPFGTKIG